MNRPHDEHRDAARLDAELASLSEAPLPASALRASILHAIAQEPRTSSPTLGETLRALWQAIGGMRLAAPALAMALAVGIGIGSMLQPVNVASDDDSEDLVTLAQFDDTYSELSP